MPDLTNEQVLVKQFFKGDYEEQGSYGNEGSFFEYISVDKVLAHYDLTAEEIESGLVGRSRDGGCDSVYIFLNGQIVREDEETALKSINGESSIQIYIIQSKTTTSFKEDVFLKWKDICTDLLQFAHKTEDYFEKYDEGILEKFEQIKTIVSTAARKSARIELSFYDVSFASEVHPNVELQRKGLIELVKGFLPIQNLNVNVEFFGAKELVEIWNPPALRELSLRFPPGSLIAVPGRTDYVGLASLASYQDFLIDKNGKLQNFLFEANIRDYQGSVQVNKEIKKTLESNETDDFWWLNNGVTILANRAWQVTGDEIRMEDPRIVNGLQTTYEVNCYMTEHENPEDSRNILVRIIVPESDETRDRVIMATNSQTTIKKTSLRATDPIQLQIEQYFKPRGLYYDRRKNYYKNQGKKREDIVSIDFLGQCLMTLLLKQPDQARARPSTLLSDDAKYNKLFPKNGDLRAFFNVACIGKKVFGILSSFQDEYTQSQISDIRFYVLLTMVAMKVRTIEITIPLLVSLSVDDITEKDIRLAAAFAFEEYRDSGGNAKAAKSSETTAKLLQSLRLELHKKADDLLARG